MILIFFFILFEIAFSMKGIIVTQYQKSERSNEIPCSGEVMEKIFYPIDSCNKLWYSFELPFGNPYSLITYDEKNGTINGYSCGFDDSTCSNCSEVLSIQEGECWNVFDDSYLQYTIGTFQEMKEGGINTYYYFCNSLCHNNKKCECGEKTLCEVIQTPQVPCHTDCHDELCTSYSQTCDEKGDVVEEDYDEGYCGGKGIITKDDGKCESAETTYTTGGEKNDFGWSIQTTCKILF